MIHLADRHFAAFAALAEAEAGLYMPPSKQAFVASRLQRRLRKKSIGDFSTYLELISGSSAEGRAERLEFVAALTTNVSSVYREPHHFVLLANDLLQRYRKQSGRKYRIWSAGCSSGEEPLSIAATCKAVLGSSWARSVEILATDVDESILARAKGRTDEPGLAGALAALPTDIVRIAIRPETNVDQAVSQLNSQITYRHHNLLAPLENEAEFDFIFCRNVTIYFSRSAQEWVHTALRRHLTHAGLLAIGHSEQLLGKSPRMVSAGRTAFRRVPEAEETLLSPEAHQPCR